jgi:hypothetical protein
MMPRPALLEPKDAERIAAEVCSVHGLGQKYRLKVEPTRRGWHLQDCKGRIDSVPPMMAEEWRQYLEERFIEAITEHEETSEA